MGDCVCAYVEVRGQLNGSQFSPSILQVPGIEPSSSGLTADVFTCHVISLGAFPLNILYMCIYDSVHTNVCCGGQRTAFESWFSSSICVPGMDSGLSLGSRLLFLLNYLVPTLILFLKKFFFN